jgi:cell wall-associated NlpC family hydrolase
MALTTVQRRIIRSGRKYLGTRYVLGGPWPCNSRQMDCDCFTKRTYNDIGIRMGWWTNQLNFGRRIAVRNRRPGDLLFFSEDGSGRLTHVGVQSVNGRLLHASSYFGKVVESELRYVRGLYAVRRPR